MRRRDLLALIGGTAATRTLTVRAEVERVSRMGILLSSGQDRIIVKPLLDALQADGYVEKTLRIEYRDAQGDLKRLPDLANELVRLEPDVLFGYWRRVSSSP